MIARMSLAWSVVILLSVPVGSAVGQSINEKGQVVLATHEVAMKAGTLYSVKVEAKGFTPRVLMQPKSLPLATTDFRKPEAYQAYYVATKDETNTIYVAPELFNLRGKGPFDYSLEVTSQPLSAKPLLEAKDELTANDLAFKADFAPRPHHKSYKIKLEAGSFYVIDMISPAGGVKRLDNYLYLLDENGKVVRSDDDGGGYPNARIIFQPTQAGEYQIIATGLGNALGEYTLTVRTTEKAEKK